MFENVCWKLISAYCSVNDKKISNNRYFIYILRSCVSIEVICPMMPLNRRGHLSICQSLSRQFVHCQFFLWRKWAWIGLFSGLAECWNVLKCLAAVFGFWIVIQLVEYWMIYDVINLHCGLVVYIWDSLFKHGARIIWIRRDQFSWIVESFQFPLDAYLMGMVSFHGINCVFVCGLRFKR